MNKIARLSLLVSAALSLGLGFSTSANALPGLKPRGATLQDLQQPSNPEIAAAEQRVDQAKAQVDLANKQVNASRALLRAAQADLKAAFSEVDALKLSAQAQGLVDQTGMTPAKAPPVSIASKVDETKDKGSQTTTATSTSTATSATTSIPATAPTPAAAPLPAATPALGDAHAIVGSDSNAEPIQLR